MTLDEYQDFAIDACTELGFKPDCIRNGQFLYNKLYKEYPDEARRISTTDADPFYDDGNIVRFWKALEEMVIYG